MSDAADEPSGELDELSAAILSALAEVPGGELPLLRLTKRFGIGASGLMRQLTLMGEATLGGIAGPGWVRVAQRDGRSLVLLTEAGRARIGAPPPR